jgi:hypothetical protein
VSLTYIKESPVGADCIGGQQRAVDDEVRPERHQGSILSAERLTLGAVRDHDRSAA